jgi:hypothetical protein
MSTGILGKLHITIEENIVLYLEWRQNVCIPVHGEVYSLQYYVIKFLSDLRQVGDLTHTNVTKNTDIHEIFSAERFSNWQSNNNTYSLINENEQGELKRSSNLTKVANNMSHSW